MPWSHQELLFWDAGKVCFSSNNVRSCLGPFELANLAINLVVVVGYSLRIGGSGRHGECNGGRGLEGFGGVTPYYYNRK